MSESKIKRIILEIDGKEVGLSLQDAKELQAALNEMFERQHTVIHCHACNPWQSVSGTITATVEPYTIRFNNGPSYIPTNTPIPSNTPLLGSGTMTAPLTTFRVEDNSAGGQLIAYWRIGETNGLWKGLCN